MDKYFNTLRSTEKLLLWENTANGRMFAPNKNTLHKKMKNALRRHHGVGAEAEFIIRIYEEQK